MFTKNLRFQVWPTYKALNNLCLSNYKVLSHNFLFNFRSVYFWFPVLLLLCSCDHNIWDNNLRHERFTSILVSQVYHFSWQRGHSRAAQIMVDREQSWGATGRGQGKIYPQKDILSPTRTHLPQFHYFPIVYWNLNLSGD
jgi:hypothetical protein